MWLDAFCLSSISDFGDSSCHGSETAETFIHQLFALVSIQFLYGLHDWCLFSFLYFIARLLTNWSEYKNRLFLVGSLLYWQAALQRSLYCQQYWIFRSNGEALSQITTLKTEATSYLDRSRKHDWCL